MIMAHALINPFHFFLSPLILLLFPSNKNVTAYVSRNYYKFQITSSMSYSTIEPSIFHPSEDDSRGKLNLFIRSLIHRLIH